MLQAIPYHLGAFCARFAPDPVSRAIGRTLGEVNWALRPGTRRLVAANLAIIHPEWSERECRDTAHRVVLNFARCIVLFLQLPFLKREDVLARCDFSGLEQAIREARAAMPEGKDSFIIASAHVGPWELGGYGLRLLGHQVHTVALDHPSPAVTQFYSARRAYLGLHAHPLVGSFAQLKEAMDRGECVALLVDRAYGKARKRFAIFGVEAEFPLGHLVLASRCSAPVITGALVFDGRDRFRYVHGGIHFPDEDADEFDKLEQLQEACLRDLEGIIRAHSDQWFHFVPLARTEVHA